MSRSEGGVESSDDRRSSSTCEADAIADLEFDLAVVPVILCGGPGSRLWPSSTPAHPKPFLDLLGGPSLFQRTALRVAALPGATALLVVTGAAHATEVRRQLVALGLDGEILAEPVGRDSAAALLAAALWVSRRTPQALMVSVASDHHIPDVDGFAAGVGAATQAAAQGAIVTFGIEPRHAATSFGYIRRGEPLEPQSAVLKVRGFEEKPDALRAEALVAEGCLWNSGNFMFRADSLLGEARTHCPELLDAVAASIPTEPPSKGLVCLQAGFAAAKAVSFDVAVLEKTSRAAVLPIDYAWSDLGSWDAVWAASDRDSLGNVVVGQASLAEGRDCLVRAEGGARVVGLGLQGLVVIARGADVLVADMRRAAQIKSCLDPPGMATPAQSEPADLEAWFAGTSAGLIDWLRTKALPTWWCFGADHARGGFHERLRWDLSATGHDRRALVQARQVFVFATAGAMGWEGPWEGAVRHGLDYLDLRFRRRDGLYRTCVHADGSPADETAFLYDHAFVLLALATACLAAPQTAKEHRIRAREIAHAVGQAFAHDGGSLRACESGGDLLADPLMHLFEAALAWIVVDDDPRWEELARSLARHCLDRMIDPTGDRIREVFDERWRPAPGPQGRVLEPGHQFEWAWLLERWGALSGDPQARRTAAALFRSGRHGVEAHSGLVVDEMDEDFVIRERTHRLWPQTERVKATLLLESDPARRLAEAASAAQALSTYFTVTPAGLWRDSPIGSGPPEDWALASSLYHIVGAIAALQGEQATTTVRRGSGTP